MGLYFPMPTNASSIRSSSVIQGEPDWGEGPINDEGDFTICIVRDGEAGNIGGGGVVFLLEGKAAITRSVTVIFLTEGSGGGTFAPEKSNKTSVGSCDAPVGGVERDSSILARAVSRTSFLASSTTMEKSLGLSDFKILSQGLPDLIPKSSLDDEGTMDTEPR